MPTFSKTLVFDNVGGVARYLRNGRINIVDAATGVLPTTLTQGGVPVTFLVSDSKGSMTFDTNATTVVATTPDGRYSDRWTAQSVIEAAATMVLSNDAGVAAYVGNPASATRVAGDAVYPTQSALGYGIPTATTYTAIQAAATAAATAGTRLVAAGTITTSSTLTLKCDADLSQLTINYTGSGAAVLFGDATTSFFRKTVRMPKVVATSKVTTGWAAVAGTVGIDVVNAYSCTVTVPYVQNFETGLRVRGDSTNGTQQTTFHLGHLDNNKVNIRFTGTATGWANQDHFYGGRCSHSSSEGSQVAGTRHVLFENIANPVNGHQFFGTSLESPDVVEYHVEAANTTWCTFYGARFENTGGDTHRRFLSTGASKNNRLHGGAYAENVTQTMTSPALPFDIDTNAQTTRHGGTSTVPTMLLENVTSSTAPLLTTMAAGAGAAGDDPATKYTTKQTANKWFGKRSTDTFDRCWVDFQNGRFYPGDATADPVGYIGGSPSVVFVGGGLPFAPLANGTQDLGLSSLKWRNGIFSNYVKVGSFATGSRPSASTSGVGAMVYDSTLSKPIWSDGTVWRDAAGTAV